MVREQEVQAPIARKWRKVLCAVDFSECSHEALEVAADLARRLQAELTIVHVRDDTAEPDPQASEREMERALARFKLIASQYVDAPVRTKLLAGPAAAELLSFSAQGGFDLVVTGTHGRTGVKRMMLGSVAEKVLRHATCPVLVTRKTPGHPEVEITPAAGPTSA